MKLFKRKEREPKRYWDFSYISNFIQRYRRDIEYLELTMERDREVREILIDGGNMIHVIGGQYQQYRSEVDGVVYSAIDYPCMRVRYVGGKEEILRCYRDINGIEGIEEGMRRVNNK